MKKLVFAFLLCAMSVSYAGFDEARDAYNSGNYAAALKEYKQAAEQGNAYAQYKLGLMYDKGKGVPQDYAQAVAWYGKAAEQGFYYAQFALGYMYTEAKGVPQDDAQAIAWYTKAAEQRDNDLFGWEYSYFNEDIIRDDTQIIAWYTKTAGQGLAFAQAKLGYMYVTGERVSQDYKKAFEWFTKAAKQGHAMAQFNLGVMYDSGPGVPQDYKQAVVWYTKAAEQGHAMAQFNLGVKYAKGEGVFKEHKIAYILFNIVTSKVSDEAQKASMFLEHDRLAKLGTKAAEQRYIALKMLTPIAREEAQRISTSLYNAKDFAAELRKVLNAHR